MAQKNSIDNISNPLWSTIVTVDPGLVAADSYITFNKTGTANYYSLGSDADAANSFKLSQSNVLGTDDRLELTTSGACLRKYQPAFLSYLPATVTNVTGDWDTYQLGGGGVFLTKVYDQHNNLDPSGGIVSITVSGLYHIHASMTLTDVNLDNCNVWIRFLVIAQNTYYMGTSGGPCRTGTTTNVQGEALIYVNAGNIIITLLKVTGLAGNRVDVIGAASPSPLFTYLCGYLVC